MLTVSWKCRAAPSHHGGLYGTLLFICPATFNDHLLLHKQTNAIVQDNKVLKCFDCRSLSTRSFVSSSAGAVPYTYTVLQKCIDLVTDWVSSVDREDSLQIKSYDMVSGAHYPSYTGLLDLVLVKTV